MAYRLSCKAEDFHPDTQAFYAGRRVAVTGGSGFIGSHLVEQLLLLKAKPIVLTRQKSPPFLAHVLNRIECIPCDLSNYIQTKNALFGAHVVLHLAAEVAGLEFNAAHPATLFQNNLQCFFNSIRAATENKVERFLTTSSACVYPRVCSLPTPEEEGFRDTPEPTNAGYGWAKRMEEFLSTSYAAEHGLSVAIARPYNTYGPRDNFTPEKSHVLPALIRKAFLTPSDHFEVWGDGSHSRSFIYVEDAARGLLEVAARHPKADAVNLGKDEEITVKDMAETIAELVSKQRGRKIIPKFNPQELTGQPRRHCDTRKAEKLLGFRAAMPFAEGMQRTIEWYAEHREKV